MNKIDLYESWESENVKKLKNIINENISFAIMSLKRNKSFAVGYFQGTIGIAFRMGMITVDQYIDIDLNEAFN